MSEGKCHNCGEEIGQNDYGVPFMEKVAYENGRADAIRELTQWRTGEPPEGVDVVIVKHIDYQDFWILRRVDDVWPFAVKQGFWDGKWQWLPIPQ